jgi:hypothetical protein
MVEKSWMTMTIDIGDWDMNANQFVDVAHGLSATEFKTIRRIDAMIRNDADTALLPLTLLTDASLNGIMGGSVQTIDSSNIRLVRTDNQLLDSTNYDSTGYNRGWITFDYISD